MTHRTVKRLADAAAPEDLFQGQWQNRPTILDEYKPYLDDRWNQGCTNAWALWEEIAPFGYKGSYQRVRAYLREKRLSPGKVSVRAMMCIHGGAGFGKTLAVNTCLRELEPTEDVRRVTFRARPAARAVRYELFTALDLAGEPPCHPSEFDRLLKTALAERPRTFLVDEAQWLNGEAFEYFRYLWDEPATQLAIIFVGGEGCHTVLRCEPMT
ncbi:AAA family ATPase [Streptomyces sp. NPDC057565]|uniref:AAA family ATPase n=1 Tax=Streptomyces sp. NPDC057565 TaxID=3346169 RepID=UPI00368C1000